jgi:hypothetical protein
MNLREEILKEHSKKQTARIIKYIGTDQKRFNELVKLFLNDEYRVVQRAAWPLSYCVIENPQLVKKHLKKIVQRLDKPGVHNAVKRNVVRLLQYIEIPGSLQGEVMNSCFKLIESPQEPVAIKTFSLTVLGNLAKYYPEIIPEIKLLIEEQLPHQTAAFRSRAKKVLRSFN